MIEGELLLAGVDWRRLNGPQFFSACEAVLARVLGGRDQLETRLEEVMTEMAVKEKGQARMAGRRVSKPTRTMSVEQARRMEADAQDYDAQMSRGA